MSEPELDPRWSWIVAPRRLGDDTVTYVRGRCLHTDVVPVESALDPDVVVARLCRTCDTQLPGDQP